MASEQQLIAQWWEDRRAKLTGSRMAIVMEGGPKQWAKLMDELEWEMWASIEELMARGDVDAPALNWGRQHEDEAIAHYELIQNVDVIRAGFTVHPELPFVGASLDFFNVVTRRAGEVKCPYNPEIHAQTVAFGMPKKHKAQTQTEIWVAGATGLDFVSYDPRYPDPMKRHVIIPIERDDAYIAEMERKCREFMDLFTAGKRPVTVEQLTEVPSFF